ncbi:DUF624 domain-containing protein [Lapidilactobacillus mulanensis]|uniref:DUF624 domain-containing protein n=1 Tax=Lapidilactobacillus mulanensis TaxID=2485999 RepID=A0ABW4DNL9_9LACO|nr:YesL family protein [Lapidilactobacillus mulanensis]
MPKYSNRFVNLIHWIPRLVVLNYLWLLASLPLVTLVSSTRTTAYLVMQYRQEDQISKNIWQTFWQTFKTTRHRFDFIRSFILVLTVIDCWLLAKMTSPLSKTALAALILILLGCTLLSSWHITLTAKYKHVSCIQVFVYCGQHFGLLLGQVLLNIVVCLTLFLFGQGFALLAGISTIIGLNIGFTHYFINSN